MWIFCLSVLTLLIDINESLPSTTEAPVAGTNPHEIFRIKELNETFKERELLIPTEKDNNTNVGDKIGNAKDPVVISQDGQNVDKSEMDKLTFEMFKMKCQHFHNLLKVNKTTDNIYRPPNYQYPNIQSRPVYTTSKPTFKPSTSRPNSFYITAQTTPSTIKPVVNIQTSQPIKYIRLEPVILQKTILSDGRTVYYWHRSLPTAVEYPSKFPTETQPAENVNNGFEAPPRDVYGYLPQNMNVPSPSNNHVSSNSYYYPVIDQNSNTDEADRKSVEITTASTTTSTTQESYGYGFGNFLPFYSLTKGESTPSTTARPTTTAAPSTEKVPTDDLVYAQQLKFIIPVPYDGNQGVYQAPWNFDRYAYYPKELQPNALNVRVPYSPTFHMIRAVAIPKLDGTDEDRIEQSGIGV